MKQIKRFFAIILSLSILVTLLPSIALTANAADFSQALLKINWSHIQTVGHQASGGQACACYSLAYCRTMLDGYVHYYSEYNNGSNQYDAWTSWSPGSYAGYFPSDKGSAYLKIYSELSAGKPVSAKVYGSRSSHHYVTFVGYENVSSTSSLSASNFLIIDPCAPSFAVENFGAVGYDLKYEYGCYQVEYDTTGKTVPFASTTVPIEPKMWFEGVKMTDTIIAGHNYTPECTVCGNNGVKWYALVIYDSQNNMIQSKGEDVWRVITSPSSYPITNAAQQLDFSTLPVGNYRLSVQCMDDDDNYFTIYEKNFSVTAPRMWFDGVKMTDIIIEGHDYTPECTVCSNNGVKWYALVIYDSQNNMIQSKGEDVWRVITSPSSYPITNAAQQLDFSTLPVGNYRLSVQCMDDDDNYFTIYEKNFSVTAPRMWFEGVKMTDTIIAGHNYTPECTVCGNNGVKWYALVIYDSQNNMIQSKGEDVWRVITSPSSYPITNAAQQLDFSTLPVGNYRLSVQCMDDDNNYFTIYDKDFTVSVPKMWCENINAPSEITEGSNFSVTGNIFCNNGVKWFALVIYDGNEEFVQNVDEAVWKVASTNSWSIDTLAKQLDFSTLTPGYYSLSIQGMDDDNNYFEAYSQKFSIIGKHQHSYLSVVTPPTCTEKGYTTHTCTCGDSYVDTYTDALDHRYTYKVTTAPTTSASGVLIGTCSRCSATTTVMLPKLNTTDYTYAVTKAASCTATGTGRYTWKTTAYGTFYFDVTIAKTTHTYTATVTAPTCTEKGYTTHTCTVCGDSYKDTYTDSLGHSWGDGVVTTKPTETSEGVKTFTCSRCGTTKTESVPALDHTHSYTATVTPPTCTEKGYTTYTCACGDSYVADYVGALGHDFVDGTCSRCGAKDPNYKPIEPDKPCDGGASCPGKSFTDMPKPNNWAHAGIDFCVENGLFAGTSATTFSPDGNMTRAMLVTVLYRLEGQPAVTASNPFSDVANGQWFTNAIIWAADKGVVSGVGGGKFNPDGNITREQIATIMYRYAEYKSYDVSATADLKPFPDEKDVSTWAYKALAWANAEGLVSGVGANGTSYLQPLGNATRAQVAAILMRYVKNIAEAK